MSYRCKRCNTITSGESGAYCSQECQYPTPSKPQESIATERESIVTERIGTSVSQSEVSGQGEGEAKAAYDRHIHRGPAFAHIAENEFLAGHASRTAEIEALKARVEELEAMNHHRVGQGVALHCAEQEAKGLRAELTAAQEEIERQKGLRANDEKCRLIGPIGSTNGAPLDEERARKWASHAAWPEDAAAIFGYTRGLEAGREEAQEENRRLREAVERSQKYFTGMKLPSRCVTLGQVTQLRIDAETAITAALAPRDQRGKEEEGV